LVAEMRLFPGLSTMSMLKKALSLKDSAVIQRLHDIFNKAQTENIKEWVADILTLVA